MASTNPECKKIEKCLKELLFKSSGNELPNSNLNPLLSASEQCLELNLHANSLKYPPFGPIIPPPVLNSLEESKLIDVKNLEDFAAKHIGPLAPSLALSFDEVRLPHPDQEEDLDLKNGEQKPVQDIAVLLSNISKSIQESPDFTGMPEIPPSVAIGTPKHKGHPKASPDNELKKKKRQNKRQVKEKKAKDRMEGLYVSNEPKTDRPKEASKSKSPSVQVSETVKEKPIEEDSKLSPDIKRKDGPFSAIGKEYSVVINEGSYKLICHLCNFHTEGTELIEKHLTSKKHHNLKMENDLDMMLPVLPDPLKPQAEAISQLVSNIASDLGLQKEDLQIRKTLCMRMQKYVEGKLPPCSVDLVGSSASGCGLKTSDVDFVLKVPSDDEIPHFLESLYNLMVSDCAFTKVVNDFKKKRPCILFVDKETSLQCTILIDYGSAVKTADLFTTYFKLDPRVLPLGIALREWARLCQIDLQDMGTMPPFSFVLFLVHFLQQVQPPVLPVLHEVKDFASDPKFYAEYLSNNKWKSLNSDSLGELWLKFFHFYVFSYRIGEHVICIRNTERVFCKDKKWSTKFFAVEDPYLRRNVAYVIPTFSVCQFIQQCFIRTYRYFAFPNLKKGTIRLLKTDAFDPLKLSEYGRNKVDSKESDDSDDSGNDEFDSSLVNDHDMEDHDPDIDIQEFVTTVANMTLSDESSSSPKKNAQKGMVKAIPQPICYWDLNGRSFTVEDLNYEFHAVTFRGEKTIPIICKACKGSGHQKKNCPRDDLPKPSVLPVMTNDFLHVISKILCHIKETNVVSPKEMRDIKLDLLKLQGFIREVFPDAILTLFGSYCNGFGFKNNSDMDFCLTFGDREDGKDLDHVDVIEKVAKELKKYPQLQNVLAITSAKVPIVKFVWARTNSEGDISLYNTLALANTELLETYTRIDQRVQALGYALKYFAKLLGICDASRGSLSSYAYILMVLYFLQQRNPPVIPVLQELHEPGEKPTKMIEGCNVWFYRDIDKLKEVWPDCGKNTETLGQLWLGLLCFYVCEFDWKEYVISIKQKAPLTRFRKLWNSYQLAIEDPFDLNHNLGAGLSRKMNSYIFKAFIRARERFGTPTSNEKFQQDPENYLFARSFLNSGMEPPHDRGCSNCGKIGHLAKNCTQEKTCSYCRLPGHLIKNCPKKNRGKKKDSNRSYNDHKNEGNRFGRRSNNNNDHHGNNNSHHHNHSNHQQQHSSNHQQQHSSNHHQQQHSTNHHQQQQHSTSHQQQHSNNHPHGNNNYHNINHPNSSLHNDPLRHLPPHRLEKKTLPPPGYPIRPPPGFPPNYPFPRPTDTVAHSPPKPPFGARPYMDHPFANAQMRPAFMNAPWPHPRAVGNRNIRPTTGHRL